MHVCSGAQGSSHDAAFVCAELPPRVSAISRSTTLPSFILTCKIPLVSTALAAGLPLWSLDMDRFYLQNVSLYQKLVEAFDPDALIPHFSRQEATPSTNPPTSRNTARRNTGVLVGARIRPMLEDDLAAGFPRAIYPRAGQVDEPQTVDLHDLYNHPRQRPVLRGCHS